MLGDENRLELEGDRNPHELEAPVLTTRKSAANILTTSWPASFLILVFGSVF